MRLHNKKTGEIVTPECFDFCLLKGAKNRGIKIKDKWYNSLTEISEDWEDYEEPHEPYRLTTFGEVVEFSEGSLSNKYKRMCVDIGNYFETKEEAEKAVEKLKAWKRLKDKGFKFTGWATNEGLRAVDFEVPDTFFSEDNHSRISGETMTDLDLLFGDEE